MTNEEKILDLLALMQGEFGKRFDTLESRMDSLEDQILQANIRTENEILPKINALFEGQAAIKEMLTPRSKIDELEDRIKFLESVVRQLLDKAQ